MTADQAAALLGSAEYEAVFAKVMSGTEPALLSDTERDLITRVRDLTGTPAPGLPMPTGYYPTRSDQA